MDSATRRIARQRIRALFDLANETSHRDPDLGQRYANSARKIAMAARISLPTENRHQICRKCKSFILPGKSCRVRIEQRREPHVTITCLICGRQTRIPLNQRNRKEHS